MKNVNFKEENSLILQFALKILHFALQCSHL
jgi:hypothetical protein